RKISIESEVQTFWINTTRFALSKIWGSTFITKDEVVVF
ncbi:hypothetical protein Tco_1558301, partial [Tanacetum coccineum]